MKGLALAALLLTTRFGVPALQLASYTPPDNGGPNGNQTNNGTR
jgi:hypothetical protein